MTHILFENKDRILEFEIYQLNCLMQGVLFKKIKFGFWTNDLNIIKEALSNRWTIPIKDDKNSIKVYHPNKETIINNGLLVLEKLVVSPKGNIAKFKIYCSSSDGYKNPVINNDCDIKEIEYELEHSSNSVFINKELIDDLEKVTINFDCVFNELFFIGEKYGRNYSLLKTDTIMEIKSNKFDSMFDKSLSNLDIQINLGSKFSFAYHDLNKLEYSNFIHLSDHKIIDG